VDVLEIAPGLWRWTGYHEEWQQDVGCVFVETGDGIVLVDPLVPPEDTARFWKALDRDVKQASGQAVHVLVSVFWHARSAAAMVDRYSARVWAPTACRAAVARRAGVVFWIPEHSALVAGDVLLGDGKRGVKMCPESWLPSGKSRRDLAASLRPLLDLPVRRVLVSHGQPILTGGGRALARALEV
jgi:hypothetical protein